MKELPIHFNDESYRNNNEHCCGLEMIPGDNCTDRLTVVTCPDCLAKLEKIIVIERPRPFSPKMPKNRKLMHVSDVNGYKMFNHPTGFLVFTKQGAYIRTLQNKSLEKARTIVDELP